MLAAVIAVLAVVLDQVTKYLVVQNIEYRGSMEFIPKIVSFYHTRNTGAAFSILSDHRWVYMLLSILSMAIIVWLLYKEYKRHILMNVALAMVLGGGIGNMIDRIRLEYVVDFLKLEFMDFAIFNIADCFVTVGAVLLAVYVVFFEPKVEKRLQAEKAKNAPEGEISPETAPELGEANSDVTAQPKEDSENG